MKTYSIPVTHTAHIVVEHEIEARNMQDAMFRLGKSIADAPDPFECVGTDFPMNVEVSPGSPRTLVDDETLDLTGDQSALAAAEAE